MNTSPQAGVAGHEGSRLRRQALGEFVRSARSRITPQMA
ncbi:transcriptional regulator, partial [Achromobacter ruhlandii]|nr:transcriptional regulator [Achromobacter ruhlandii]